MKQEESVSESDGFNGNLKDLRLLSGVEEMQIRFLAGSYKL